MWGMTLDRTQLPPYRHKLVKRTYISSCCFVNESTETEVERAATQGAARLVGHSHLVRCWRPHKRSRPQGTLVPTHTFARTHTSLYIGFRRQSGSSW